MKALLLLILVSFSICNKKEKNVEEEDILLKSSAAVLSQYLSMKTNLNHYETMLQKYSAKYLSLQKKLNDLEKQIEKHESKQTINETVLKKLLEEEDSLNEQILEIDSLINQYNALIEQLKALIEAYKQKFHLELQNTNMIGN